jgi:hypothetical protein
MRAIVDDVAVQKNPLNLCYPAQAKTSGSADAGPDDSFAERYGSS